MLVDHFLKPSETRMRNIELASGIAFLVWLVWVVLLIGTIGWVIYSVIADPSGVAQAVGSFFGTLADAFNSPGK